MNSLNSNRITIGRPGRYIELSEFGIVEWLRLSFRCLSAKSLALFKWQPLSHVPTPNMIATIKLTGGGTAQIEIVPAVLKPAPVPPPSDGILEGTHRGKDQACDKEVA